MTVRGTGGGKRPKRVLAIMLELDQWRSARTWAYVSSYALLDGFEACGMEWTVLPSLLRYPDNKSNPWVEAREALLGNETFDQVWVWLTHPHYPPAFWAWLEKVAPVRVGVLMESLRYTPEEVASYPGSATRFAEAVRQMRHLTHAVSFDEQDVHALAQATGQPTRLFYCMIPADMVRQDPAPATGPVLFLGSLYDKRRAFLDKAGVGDRLAVLSSPEETSGLDVAFDESHRLALAALAEGRMTRAAMRDVVLQWRAIRRAMLNDVMDIYRGGAAVLNLPSYFKGHPGRVVEAQAAGVPVLTNILRDRPVAQAAYRPGRDIAYYDPDDPGDLARQIDALTGDLGLRETIVANARALVLRSMTSEAQMPLLQAWIARTARTGLQRWIARTWPKEWKPPPLLAIANGAEVAPLDSRKGLVVRTGSWSDRAVNGPNLQRLEDGNALIYTQECWSVGLVACVGELLAGADWLVVELMDLTQSVSLSLVDAATEEVFSRAVTPLGAEALELWLPADRRANTLVVQAGAQPAFLRLGRLRGVRGDPPRVKTPAEASHEAAAGADSLARSLRAYRTGDRQWPLPGDRNLLLRDDGLKSRLGDEPARSIALDASVVMGLGASRTTQDAAEIRIEPTPGGALWSYFAAVDIALHLRSGRQSVVARLGPSQAAFAIGVLNKDQTGFVQRWVIPAGVDSAEVWFDVVEPSRVSLVVWQHWDPPFEGTAVLRGISVVQT